MIWCHNAPTFLRALLCLDILFLLERTRWRQSGKSQLSLNTFFNFLVPEDWIFLSWLEAGEFMSEPDSVVLIYGAIMETWSFGMNIWPLVTITGFGKWEFLRICWNFESEAKIYSSSNDSSLPKRWHLTKCLSSAFQFQNFCIGTKHTSEGLWWELNERKYRLHTAWHTDGKKY